MNDLDQLLSILARVAWLIFIVYAIIVFVRSLRADESWLIACLRVLSARVLLPLLIPVGLTLLSVALVFVQPNQVAIVISYISPGGIRPQPLRAGMHLIAPLLEREIFYPISWQTYTMSGKSSEEIKGGDGTARARSNDDSIRARTSDGQEIRLDISIIFRINFEQVVTLHTDWQDRYIADFIRPVIRGLVRTQVSQFKVKEVNSSQRKDLESTLERLLTTEFAAKGLIVDQLQLRDITFTSEYAAAIERKQVALEDEARTLYEAQQMRNLAEGKRDEAKLIAAGDAEATLIRAQAQAESLAKIGSVLAQTPSLITYEYVQKLSPNIRAMLLPSNAPLLLPMSELMSTNNQPNITATAATSHQSLLSSLPLTAGLTTPLTPAQLTNLAGELTSSLAPTATVPTKKER